ncbi:MAG: hypothetical protein LBQ29_04625, partial [Acinetobacter sp.]
MTHSLNFTKKHSAILGESPLNQPLTQGMICKPLLLATAIALSMNLNAGQSVAVQPLGHVESTTS